MNQKIMKNRMKMKLVVTVQAHDGENGENDENLEHGIQDIRPEPGIPQLNEDDNECTDTAKYEYLHNGIAVGIVENVNTLNTLNLVSWFTENRSWISK